MLWVLRLQQSGKTSLLSLGDFTLKHTHKGRALLSEAALVLPAPTAVPTTLPDLLNSLWKDTGFGGKIFFLDEASPLVATLQVTASILRIQGGGFNFFFLPKRHPELVLTVNWWNSIPFYSFSPRTILFSPPQCAAPLRIFLSVVIHATHSHPSIWDPPFPCLSRLENHWCSDCTNHMLRTVTPHWQLTSKPFFE